MAPIPKGKKGARTTMMWVSSEGDEGSSAITSDCQPQQARLRFAERSPNHDAGEKGLGEDNFVEDVDEDVVDDAEAGNVGQNEIGNTMDVGDPDEVEH
jgi:hypothetical protein